MLGASPLKKPVAPSSFAITLKQSIIPLYDWTLPKLSLAWRKPCTFKKSGAPLIDHHYIFNVWHCSYGDSFLKLFTKKRYIYSVSILILSTGYVAFKDSIIIAQHEQFYPEGLSVFALFPLGWIKLAQKFKDFPPPSAFFKDFQGLELISKFKNFHGVWKPCQYLYPPYCFSYSPYGSDEENLCNSHGLKNYLLEIFPLTFA